MLGGATLMPAATAPIPVSMKEKCSGARAARKKAAIWANSAPNGASRTAQTRI